jgi:hypothetical protein
MQADGPKATSEVTNCVMVRHAASRLYHAGQASVANCLREDRFQTARDCWVDVIFLA